MSRYTLLILNGAILTGCAVFIYPGRSAVLIALLLLLPLLDRAWHMPVLTPKNNHIPILIVLFLLYGLMVIMHPPYAEQAVAILLLTALPEEWFFRAYFMTQLEKYFADTHNTHSTNAWLANTTASLLFALLHTPTQGWFGLSVFFPSLFFGWIYQKQKNLILVIVLHAISNLVFIIYLKEFLQNISINY